MKGLTPHQIAVLAFVREHIEGNGYPPTRTEIAAHFKWTSANAAHECLRALARKGELELISGVARGLRLPRLTITEA